MFRDLGEGPRLAIFPEGYLKDVPDATRLVATDVMEGREPLPLPIATWPISAAQLTFSPPESSECGSIGPDSAALSGAVIATPLGDVELGEIVIVNDAYGCLAG